MNCYIPNSQRDLARLPYRLTFEDKMRQYLMDLDSHKPVVYCGDLNVAHHEIDLKNAKPNIGNSGFTYEERNKMTELLGAGFVDSFRYLYPDRTEAYTWWSYINRARARNIGWRIDYFIVSERLKEFILAAEIHADIKGVITVQSF